MDFWHLYAPQAQYHNRFLACRRLWETKSKQERALIMNELAQKQTANPLSYNEKNPYFFLIDWQPPQADWLAPKQVAYLLAQKDLAGGKKTMKAYLWKVCGEQYDSTHQG